MVLALFITIFIAICAIFYINFLFTFKQRQHNRHLEKSSKICHFRQFYPTE